MNNKIPDSALTIENVRMILSSVIKSKYAQYLLSNKLYEVRIISKLDNEKAIKGVNSLAISHTGVLYICREFLDKYLRSADDIKLLFLHEILHQLLSDCTTVEQFDIKDPDIRLMLLASNIAQDLRINAYIYKYAEQNKINNTIFEHIYSDILSQNNNEVMFRFLKPNSTFDLKEKADQDLSVVIADYTNLYSSSTPIAIPFWKSYDAILRYMKRKKDEYEKKFNLISDNLLGYHNFDPNNPTIDMDLGQDEDEDDIGDNLPEALASELEDEMRDALRDPGVNHNAATSIIKLKDNVDDKIDFEAFKRLSFDNVVQNIRLEGYNRIKCPRVTPVIPHRLGRRDIYLLMNGVIPSLWKKTIAIEEKKKQMLPIYLDVSGSMYSALPEIIRLITNVEETLEFVWGFSNKVYKHTLDELKEGKIKSTGGTDFDCIIDHAIKEGYRSLMVITDGEAYCNRPQQKLDEIDQVILVLATSWRQPNNWFSKVYEETKNIEEMTV